MEAEAVKENLEAQLSIVDKKKEELEHMQRQEIENWKLSPDFLPKKPKSAW